MRQLMKLLPAVLLLMTGIAQVSAQSIPLEGDPVAVKKYMKTITVQELKDHLYTIASDEYEGRETGTLGQKKAADYIARHFMKNDLMGPVKDNPNPYLQPIDFYGRYVRSVNLSSPTATLALGKDFSTRSLADVDLKNTELVFLGYGIEKAGYNDLEGLNLKGKGVVLINDKPVNKKGEPLFTDLPTTRDQFNALIEKGVKFIISMPLSSEDAENTIRRFGNRITRPRLSLQKGNGKPAAVPSLVVKSSAVAQLFGEDPAAFDKAMAKGVKKGKPMGGMYTSKVNLLFDYAEQGVSSENVLGFLEGTDLKDEILVVTSHYDHIGISADGQINNGADDDGSGTVGLLEVANAFATAAKDGYRPRRSILFMTVTGEEKGLLGSRYYSENPIFPLDKTITNLNIDMIGRVDPDRAADPRYIYIIGSTMLSSDLHKISETAAAKFVPELDLDYKYNSKDDPQRFYYRSDHYNFAKHNIPIVFYFNGTHEDYHRPTDTPDKIGYELLAERAKLVFVTAWELANRSKAPVVDQVEKD